MHVQPTPSVLAVLLREQHADAQTEQHDFRRASSHIMSQWCHTRWNLGSIDSLTGKVWLAEHQRKSFQRAIALDFCQGLRMLGTQN